MTGRLGALGGRPGSDIDLVAIPYDMAGQPPPPQIPDDLDYSSRRERSDDLKELAGSVVVHRVSVYVTDWPEWPPRRLGLLTPREVGPSPLAGSVVAHRVSVYVTDWPEWTHRATRVSTSLECAITADAVTLYHREPNGVRWGKEIGMPTTNEGEAAGRLHNARRALFGVNDHLTMSLSERSALEDRDPGYYLLGMRDRMCRVCADAHMTMESSLKALIHLGGMRPARTHDLDELLSPLPAAQRDHLRGMFVEVSPEQASKWREAGAYEYADWSLERLVPHAYHMARTSIGLARYVADLLSGTEPGRLINKVAARSEDMLDGWDLSAGDPFEVVGQPPPPELAE